jgi:hypothetical protein
MSAATSVMLATQHGSNISPTFALTTALILTTMVIYLAIATIYYGGKDEDSKINSSKPIDK